MGKVESRLEQRSRATYGAVAEVALISIKATVVPAIINDLSIKLQGLDFLSLPDK
ncbi:MAG: hypothetical protein PSV18_11190 [Methylobacter sp.]|uniref:Uncharacterized protein n=1 Tax=Candidatus Methylobacter titanis TaxID=3053457 RepID=A0AA43Q596_9GAMM|nr:hypothetical protein [Candidatus Methylobacter titanis]MDI1293296.1 hypothetical protein [Candidatus Methylobacter titanis]